jgi:hypothetical protein
MSTIIQLRRDTAANWTSNDPILASGEIGYETDTDKFKIGTGNTAWTSLLYFQANAQVTINSPTFSNSTWTGTVNTTSGTFASGLTLDSPVFINSIVGSYYNMEVFTTTGTGQVWTVPLPLRVVGAKWKVILVGGGGQGGGTLNTAGQTGSGGGSGATVVGFYSYVAGQITMGYAIGIAGSGAGNSANGNNGTDTTTTYNSTTYTAGFGAGGATHSTGIGGAGGTATGGTLNLAGQPGASGGTMAATSNYQGNGGNSPLGFGMGGQMPATAGGLNGVAASGYGAGGSGGRNGTGTTARAGGAGTQGLLIILY